VANLTPFRGPSMDVGTAFEIGFGAALHLPIFGYANVSELLVQRVVRRSSPLPSAPVDENGMEVENFGFFENLMVEVPILQTAGAIEFEMVPEGERFTNLAIFERCIERVSQVLTSSGRARQRA